MRNPAHPLSLLVLGPLLLVAATLPAQPVGRASRTGTPIGQRPADDRPQHDDAALRDLGIHRYASRRMILYSDIDPAIARTLPPLVDAVYPEWVRYFGELPPAADASEFQLTGYLMQDRGLFLEAGLLPEDLVDFQHGKHRGYQFWMAEQKYDYYRRHLFLHEATHCFMLIEPAVSRPPLYYLEGMAEWFGSHILSPEGTVRFGQYPASEEATLGFGRVEMIQRAVELGEGRSLEEAWSLSAADFTQSREEPYAWAWAVCTFLDAHPRTRERFRRLAGVRDGTEFRRLALDLFAEDFPRLSLEWELFTRTIDYGYDIERAAIEFQPGHRLMANVPVSATVQADRGWQCSGVAVVAGEEYRVTAEGEVTLAREPKPWVSYPPGVTIRYSGGYPIGRLTGIVLPGEGQETHASAVIDLGESAVFRSPRDGVLYLRVNDAWGGLSDNTGHYRVTIESP